MRSMARSMLSLDAGVAVSKKRSWALPYSRIGVLDGVVFIAPLLRFIEINIVGHLYFTDLVLAGLLPFLFLRYGRRLSARLPRTVIILLVLWLLAQIVTDLIRETPFHDYARGWSLISFTLINFCSLYLLLAGNRKRLVLFTAGAALGQIAGYLIAPTEYALGMPWKFGYGDGVSWLLALFGVALASGRRFAQLRPAAVLLLVAALNIAMGYRSLGGIAFLAACFLAAQALRRSRNTPTRIRPRQLIILGGMAAIGALGVLRLYEHAAQAGWLGADARQKYEMQASDKYGLMVGGRSEILVSALAVLNSPLIGHGSWAKDCRYASLYVELKRSEGYFPGEENEKCLIPTHSHLMGSWVQAGVLGAIFWAWVLTLPCRTLVHLYNGAERLTPLVALLAILLIWDIFFSPFGGERRFLTPFYIVLMMSFLPARANRN